MVATQSGPRRSKRRGGPLKKKMRQFLEWQFESICEANVPCLFLTSNSARFVMLYMHSNAEEAENVQQAHRS